MRSKNLIRTTTYSPRLDYILLEQLGYILLARLDYILREGSAEGSAEGESASACAAMVAPPPMRVTAADASCCV